MPTNHHQQIQALITAIKADKGIVQPWRNYAIKALSEAQAFVKMGETVAPGYRREDEL